MALGAVSGSFVALFQLPSTERMSPYTRPQEELLPLQGTEERDIKVYPRAPGLVLCMLSWNWVSESSKTMLTSHPSKGEAIKK